MPGAGGFERKKCGTIVRRDRGRSMGLSWGSNTATHAPRGFDAPSFQTKPLPISAKKSNAVVLKNAWLYSLHIDLPYFGGFINIQKPDSDFLQ